MLYGSILQNAAKLLNNVGVLYNFQTSCFSNISIQVYWFLLIIIIMLFWFNSLLHNWKANEIPSGATTYRKLYDKFLSRLMLYSKIVRFVMCDVRF